MKNTAWHHKLLLQLGIPFVGFIFAILTSLLTLTIISYFKNVNNAKKIPVQEAERLSTALYQILLYSKNDLLHASRNTDLHSQSNHFLQDLVNTNGMLLELTFFDISGAETFRLTKSTIGAVTDVLPNAKGLPFFDETLKIHKEYLGEPFISTSDIPFVYWSAPVKDPDGTSIGIVRATLDLTVLWDIISRTPTGQAYIVDDQGGLLISQNLQKQNKQSFSSVPSVLAFKKNVKGTYEYSDLKNQIVVASWNQIPLTKWAVIVEIPKAEIFVDTYSSLTYSFLLIIVILFITVYEIRQINNKVFHPLTVLQEGAKNLGNELLDTKVETRVNNEFDTVALTFNEMATKLKSSYELLEQKVQQRTEELEKSKKILEEKFSENERINKLMVGRELKMIELKREIERLKMDKVT